MVINLSLGYSCRDSPLLYLKKFILVCAVAQRLRLGLAAKAPAVGFFCRETGLRHVCAGYVNFSVYLLIPFERTLIQMDFERTLIEYGAIFFLQIRCLLILE